MTARILSLFPGSKLHSSADDFAVWYSAYCRKAAKADAEKAYIQAIRMGADPAAMLQGARAYAEFHRKEGTESKYILLPASFLRGQRWEDEELLDHIPPTPEAIAEAKDKADRLMQRGIYKPK